MYNSVVDVDELSVTIRGRRCLPPNNEASSGPSQCAYKLSVVGASNSWSLLPACCTIECIFCLFTLLPTNHKVVVVYAVAGGLLSVSPVTECSSPEPHRCLTRLCQQYSSPSTTMPETSVPSPTLTTSPSSVSAVASEYAVPCNVRTTAPVTTVPESAMPGGVVTSVWGCPLRSTHITSPPDDTGLYQVIS